MEILLLLLLLLVIGLPIAAIAMAVAARSKAVALEARLTEIRKELDLLRREAESTRRVEAPRDREAPLVPPVGTAPAASAPVPPREPAVHAAPAEPPPVPVSVRTFSSAASTGAAVPPRGVGSTPPPPALPPAGVPRPRRRLDWEQFMGARLFAWVGGFALFLAVAFFVKFSFDHDLVSPGMRIALGYLAALGLLVGGMAMARRKDYRATRVTAHTLCATGIVALYAVTFAAHNVYDFAFFGPLQTFLIMSLITAAAFLLAARLDAVGVAVLGLLGGFLTPWLVSSWGADPVPLFTYVGLLDLGLLALVAAKRWDWLTVPAALGTAILQGAWVDGFFRSDILALICGMHLAFAALFAGAYLLAWRRAGGTERGGVAAPSRALFIGAQIPAWATLLMVLMAVSRWPIGDRCVVLLGTLFIADLILLTIVAVRAGNRAMEPIVTAAVFLTLAQWIREFGTDDRLPWVLAAALGFGIVHIGFPILVQRRQPERGYSPWSLLPPLLALGLLAIPVFSEGIDSWLVWVAVGIVGLLTTLLAVASGSVLVLVLTLLAAWVFIGAWTTLVPAEAGELAELLSVIGGFGLLFLVLGSLFGRRILDRQQMLGSQAADRGIGFAAIRPETLMEATPALAAGLPFFLLASVVVRIPLPDPGPVFGLALLLGLVLLGLCRLSGREWLPAAGLAATLALEHLWYFRHFDVGRPVAPLVWHLVFCAAYAIFPFLALRGTTRMVVPWIVGALSGPAHFFLVHSLVGRAWPNEMMGLLPAAFAVPAFVGFLLARKCVSSGHPGRNAILATHGGAVLFFVTLIFPIQFEREWLTVAWALEGAALLWLFHRIPHRGLRVTGLVLLGIAFVRLALNPAVFSYHVRAETPILNWYLYAYGIVIVSLSVGARLLHSPPFRLGSGGPEFRHLLVAMATVLGFLLLNIEIADFFTPPGAPVLAFEFSGSLARDMTYSIAWAFFALGLLIAGMVRRVRSARIAGIVLMAVTLLKLFLHDLAALEQLYRIGALVGVAVLAIIASFLYQKLMRPDGPTDADANASDSDSGAAAAAAAVDGSRPPPSPGPDADLSEDSVSDAPSDPRL